MTSKKKKIDLSSFKEFTKNLIINRKTNEDWLKSVENGKIGEARTRTFFINNGFWVLERSVDVNGADYIIQRRDLVNDLIDIEASPVAFIQSKFVSDEENEMAVDSKYIYYIDNETLKTKNEFFLLIHFDEEETSKMLCLSSSEIDKLVNSKKLKLIEHKNKKGEVFKTEVVFTLKQLFQHFEPFTSKKDILEKINTAIESANYFRVIGNRRFLGISPQKEIINKKIGHRYNDGDVISNNFYESKKEIYTLIKNVTEYVYTLKDLLSIEEPDILIDEFNNNKDFIKTIKDKICEENFDNLRTNIERLNTSINESQVIVDSNKVESAYQEDEELLKYLLDNSEEIQQKSVQDLRVIKRWLKQSFSDLEQNVFVKKSNYYPSDLKKIIDTELEKNKK
ncbi:hypothetical protein AB1L12_19790 [Peribacillus frigoritolerans]|uniref:hypothetical protein n=1 Tax=Peribacillus frigoritolerans TaxID=450367 RepID=UPI0039A35BFF